MEPAAPSAANADTNPLVKPEIARRPPARNRNSTIIFFSPWIPYAIAACPMLLGIQQVRQIHHLNGELAAARETIRTWQWQVTQNAEMKAFAHIRVVPLDAKDPAYASALLFVAWNSALHQGIVTVQNLPAAPTGYDYQLWVLDPHEPAPLSAGPLTAANRSRNFSVHPLATPDPGFAVSLEPAGGSPAPTGPILFAVAPIE